MAKSPEQGIASLFKNLEAATGKTKDEWIGIAKSAGITKHKKLVDHLKAEYGITHGYANQVALAALSPHNVSTTVEGNTVDAQYEGKRASLRPLYDKLVEVARVFGPDVELSPKKGYVSLRRHKQFGCIQPGANRVDVGLVLPGMESGSRLEAAGSFNAMMSHRVRITSLDDIDEEMIGWMLQAYEIA